MSTRIGIISDTHSSTRPLLAALEIFRAEDTDTIICAGDVAGYGEDELAETVSLLQQHHCHIVSGNHDMFEQTDNRPAEELRDFFNALPKYLELTIEGKRLYIVHASPPDQQHGGIKLLDQSGQLIDAQLESWQKQLNTDSDVLIVGHTHQVFAQYIGHTLVINPGSTLYNHSCMILSLPEMRVSCYALENKKIIKSWNWGLLFNQSS